METTWLKEPLVLVEGMSALELQKEPILYPYFAVLPINSEVQIPVASHFLYSPVDLDLYLFPTDNVYIRSFSYPISREKWTRTVRKECITKNLPLKLPWYCSLPVRSFGSALAFSDITFWKNSLVVL